MTDVQLGDVKKARDLMWTILSIKCFFVRRCHVCDLIHSAGRISGIV